jgi:hypothetical protein
MSHLMRSGGSIAACAVICHITHSTHVHILELNGESYRLKQSAARRKRGAHRSDETDVADPQTGEINLAN